MPRYRDVLKHADRLGRMHGGNATMYYWDSTNPELEDFRKVLNGINDGDPEILDTLPSSPLSGEFAGDMTPQLLYEEVDATKRQIEDASNEICDAYENGFNTGVQDAITESCLEGMRRSVVFHVTVDLTEQKEDEILSKLVDLLSQNNCDLVYDEWEEA